jgi:ataxia telangiectasia mutated family protein
MEKPMNIWEHCFNPAVQIISAPGYQVDASTAKIFHECAVFADRQYQAIARSPESIRRKVYVDRKANEVRDLQSQAQRGSNNARSMLNKAQRQLRSDQELYERHITALRTFLQQAVGMYARCLETSDLFDDDAHVRLVSLWYANFGDAQVASVLEPAIERIPSSKFLFLSHQLTARLAKPAAEPATGSKAHKTRSASPEFAMASQDVLQRLVLRMCVEHPFHSVYQLFPLRPEEGGKPRRQSGRLETSQPQSQKERAAAAADLFAKLREGANAQRIRDVENFCQACLHWAKTSVKAQVHANPSRKEHPANGMTMLIDEKFFANLRIPVPTLFTPVDPTMKYDNCVWVRRYSSVFKTAGGLNLPKIHNCYGSDGKKYTQLASFSIKSTRLFSDTRP